MTTSEFAKAPSRYMYPASLPATATKWKYKAPYDASGNAFGPFTVGQTIRIRTSVTNTHGTRTGGVRQLTLIAPPE